MLLLLNMDSLNDLVLNTIRLLKIAHDYIYLLTVVAPEMIEGGTEDGPMEMAPI